MSKPALRIDWATHEAAAFACKHWHYSQVTPAGKLVKVGVWEDGAFIGVVLFSRGANNNIGRPFGLSQTEVCELTRIALRGHKTPVSRVVRLALVFLRQQSPGLRLIVSYADPLQGHHGGIYQAGGWLYVGKSQAQREVMYRGKVMHKRTAHDKFGTIKGLRPSPVLWKHKYLMPLDAALRVELQQHAQPYPKRPKQAIDGSPSSSGGAEPTRTLQNDEA